MEITRGFYTPFFCLDTKEPKNQDSKMLPWPHVAFALQIGQNHRAVPSCPASHPQALRFSPKLMPSPPHKLPCSARFHPEAVCCRRKSRTENENYE